jgi:hypothetical protein
MHIFPYTTATRLQSQGTNQWDRVSITLKTRFGSVDTRAARVGILCMFMKKTRFRWECNVRKGCFQTCDWECFMGSIGHTSVHAHNSHHPTKPSVYFPVTEGAASDGSASCFYVSGLGQGTTFHHLLEGGVSQTECFKTAL